MKIKLCHCLAYNFSVAPFLNPIPCPPTGRMWSNTCKVFLWHSPLPSCPSNTTPHPWYSGHPALLPFVEYSKFFSSLAFSGYIRQSCGTCRTRMRQVCFFSSFFLLFRAAWHMEVPRLRAESELQLLADATATATPDPSQVCNLHHSPRQCQIPDPLSKARDQTCTLMDTSQIHFHCATMGTPRILNSWCN